MIITILSVSLLVKNRNKLLIKIQKPKNKIREEEFKKEIYRMKDDNNDRSGSEIENNDMQGIEFDDLVGRPLKRTPTFHLPTIDKVHEEERHSQVLNYNKKKIDLDENGSIKDHSENIEDEEIKQVEINSEILEQEIINFKIERLIGLEKDKKEFDEKYKQSLWEYINKNSIKDRKNTGTVVGMTVFGAMGFIIFSGTIYLSLLGGLLGLGVGRMIGSRLQRQIDCQSLDLRVMFEMELVIKWAKRQRKKKLLDDTWFVLLLETIIMEISYLLNKLHITKVRKFFNSFRKFLLLKDSAENIAKFLPNRQHLSSDDDSAK